MAKRQQATQQLECHLQLEVVYYTAIGKATGDPSSAKGGQSIP